MPDPDFDGERQVNMGGGCVFAVYLLLLAATFLVLYFWR